MNSWEFNKIAGAVLGTLVFGMGLGVLAEIIFHEEPPAEPGYRIEIAELETPEGEEAPKEEPFAVLLARGSADAGRNAARVCGACHTFDEGGASGVGPNLYGIVGAPILHEADYNYSSAFRSFGADKRWNYEELDHFLENPQGYVRGTKMSFAGISDPQRRADVILYMKSLSPDAPPLPEPPAETASAPTETATDAADGDADATAPADDGTAPADGDADAAAPADDGTAPADGDATTADDGTAPADDATAPADDGTAAPEDAAAPADDRAAAPDDGAAAAAGSGFEQLVAAADPAQGERDARVCVACHTFDEGGPNRVGPNLHGIVGAPVLHKSDYAYSPAMQKFAEEHPDWTVDLLDQYIEAPMQFIPGTKMTFAGVKDENRRAAIVAYLRSVSPDAPPLDDARAPAASGEETQQASAAPSGDTTASGDAAAGDTASTAATAEAPTGDGTAADTPQQAEVTAAPGADEQAAAAASARASEAADEAGDGGASVAVISPGGEPEVAVAPAPADSDAAAAEATGDAAAPAQVAAAGDSGGTDGDAAASDPFVQLVAAADPAQGEREARACVACHSFEQGGPRKVGPNLWDIVGGKVLKADGFAYSPAMQKWAETHPEWTIGLLDEYLAAPSRLVPGTKMAFPGVRDEEKRAAVIAYLRSLSDDPVPLPGAQ